MISVLNLFEISQYGGLLRTDPRILTKAGLNAASSGNVKAGSYESMGPLKKIFRKIINNTSTEDLVNQR